jgi:branched-subunit amino acid aminotransferase/4-amino-4-deoxychorismate lyase
MLLYSIEPTGPRPLPIPPSATQLTDLYEGLALGVYSVWRSFEHNQFLGLDAHLDRTEQSMRLLDWDYPFDRPRFLHALHQVCTAAPYPDMRVRLDILAEPATPLGTDSRELLALQPFTPPPAELYEQGVAVDYARNLSRHDPLIKRAEFAQRRLGVQGSAGAEEQRSRGAEEEPAVSGEQSPISSLQSPNLPISRSPIYEHLLLSESGHILEGTGTNFYGVREGVVWTAAEGVLEGITRRIILSLLSELGIPLRLEAVHVDDIGRLDEAALSGSSRALLPVVEIAGQKVGDGRPGPISLRILAAYQAFVAKNIRPAVNQPR